MQLARSERRKVGKTSFMPRVAMPREGQRGPAPILTLVGHRS